ncbi:MAG: hypothetical protein LBK99_24160 [Opitutaceae bacterium]|jgi:hypothetical protein|nr:hypothetical protein [Opitutaceae bacterium]
MSMPRKPDAFKRLKTSVALDQGVIRFLGREATMRGKSMSVSRLIEHLVLLAQDNPSLLPPPPEMANHKNQKFIKTGISEL